MQILYHFLPGLEHTQSLACAERSRANPSWISRIPVLVGHLQSSREVACVHVMVIDSMMELQTVSFKCLTLKKNLLGSGFKNSAEALCRLTKTGLMLSSQMINTHDCDLFLVALVHF